ncbi:MAG: aminomethyl-transferring glycine dehydrogenase subunit GcvPA [Acidobacteria bacterium]|nr:aminomethyl-transferring glycine dehydrogenase subunit GcvPA [Acidobacteriota bacterium]
MRYIPHAAEERAEMLGTLGRHDIEELFQVIPPPVRLRKPLQLPPGLSEPEVLESLGQLAARNTAARGFRSFLGAGAYTHFAPAHIDALISRSEFFTSYTPYQPEVAQGTLQAIFEFQTMICQLTGMDVANASLYDGSTAMAEAVLMALRITGRKRIVVAGSVHPHYRDVTRTYTRNLGIEIDTAGYDTGSGQLKAEGFSLDGTTAALVVQSPNFLGGVEDLAAWSLAAHDQGALLIVVVAEPMSLALLRSPGDCGADIVVGEGQSFGIPVSYGGPYVGLFATREKYVRQMPGRLVGQAFDGQGRRGFVLTLSTREQHIRREKATSNICTNQGLFALMATIYLATMGPAGLREVAEQNWQKTAYLAGRLEGSRDAGLRFSGPFFNELVIRLRRPLPSLLARAHAEEMLAGLPLGDYYPELEDCLLTCVTEVHTRADLDQLAEVILRS